ncbi:MAG TPA: RecX family transcriptional regulator [Candidatus Bathyarchaeia archaeon]|nr:RecX family transcriptional regulator [Candidatus Bathyarchaeia archaeon]
MKSGVITAVHQDSKQKKRYDIYIDDSLAFSVHEDILVKYQLFKGKELEDKQFAEILIAEERNKAFLQALRYLGIRPRSSAQLERYLIEKGHEKEIAKEVCERCERQGYIDDEEFAKQWVRERLKWKQRSSYALRRELQLKGISSDIIHSVMQGISRDDELDAARKFANKRLKGESRPLDIHHERKLLQALARNGFSTTILNQLRSEWRSIKGSDEW